ncbi:MAG: methanogenesis marker 16 metalloprotein [Methanomicrobiaceae archaeon]|nr:methanogenesis marker 16 metalloprotein [Methanomicrobiaceae archaeon]MDD5419529.1 methanogenesis marker 16 metalloprotein [Methanomicrobiaceae archaeon]
MKTLYGIREKVEDGTAVVLTAEEFKARVREGERFAAADVDVVTCGTCGVMSGTAAIFSIPLAERGRFTRASRIWLNKVPGFVGPCPNERLGLADLIVYATAHGGAEYGGGHLFCDIVAGREVEVIAETDAGRIERTVTREDIPFARMMTTRSAYRNYLAMVNRRSTTVPTIFSVLGLRGPCLEASVSGCGEINPLENDPHMTTIRAGRRILLNGAAGGVMGEGTRSTDEKPNLGAFADMAGMNPAYMGGFVTSGGPECWTSVAVPIPVLDDRQIAALSILDEAIPLPIADINDRLPFAESTYARVWRDTDPAVSVDPDACIECEPCAAAAACPGRAAAPGGGIDRDRCYACGTCVAACPGGVYSCHLGTLPIAGREVPITLRQSDRGRALAICRDLKERMLDGRFSLL